MPIITTHCCMYLRDNDDLVREGDSLKYSTVHTTIGKSVFFHAWEHMGLTKGLIQGFRGILPDRKKNLFLIIWIMNLRYEPEGKCQESVLIGTDAFSHPFISRKIHRIPQKKLIFYSCSFRNKRHTYNII